MMEPSFEKLLALLADAEIRFVVVGGLAVSMQGYVRLTEDVGVLVDSSPDNIQNLLATLASYGEGFARELSPDDFTDTEGAIRIVEVAEQCQIDIFTRMSGKTYQDILATADWFDIRDRRVAFASKRSLIDWKSRSVREKDRLDALALERLAENPRAFD